DGFVDLLIDVVAEHVFEVGLGTEILDGQGGEFVLPAAMGDEDIGDGELAIAVDPPEEAGLIGERMGGAPAVTTIDEAHIDEAIVSGFDNIEAVDCAGSVDGTVKVGLLIFGINPHGEFRRLLLYRAIPLSIRRARLSGLDINLRPTETPVPKTGVV